MFGGKGRGGFGGGKGGLGFDMCGYVFSAPVLSFARQLQPWGGRGKARPLGGIAFKGFINCMFFMVLILIQRFCLMSQCVCFINQLLCLKNQWPYPINQWFHMGCPVFLLCRSTVLFDISVVPINQLFCWMRRWQIW